MRIDPANKPEIQRPIPPSNGSTQPVDSGGPSPAAQTGRPETTEAVHKSYIRKAVAGGDVDLQAVAEAKKLLDGGQLDTPEAIARAAENIVIRGI